MLNRSGYGKVTKYRATPKLKVLANQDRLVDLLVLVLVGLPHAATLIITKDVGGPSMEKTKHISREFDMNLLSVRRP